MKILKRLFLIIVVLVIVVVGVAYVLPSHVRLDRSIDIQVPAKDVFANVNDLKKWPQWSPWHAMEPTAKYEYSGSESGEGAKVAWEGEQVGQGTQQITKSVPNSRIETALDFKDQGTATSDWTFVESEGRTKVSWGFDTELGMNPIGRYFGLMMESMLGPQYEEGLAKLKEVCEATGSPSTKPEETVIPETGGTIQEQSDSGPSEEPKPEE